MEKAKAKAKAKMEVSKRILLEVSCKERRVTRGRAKGKTREKARKASEVLFAAFSLYSQVTTLVSGDFQARMAKGKMVKGRKGRARTAKAKAGGYWIFFFAP